MRLVPILLLVATLGAALSGCTEADLDATAGGDAPGPAGEPPATLDEATDGEAPSGSNAGTAASHGQPQRTDGEVTVSMQGTQYRAEQVVTLTNDFGGAQSAQLGISTFNGNVRAGDGGNGYSIVVTLYATGDSEQAARDLLATLNVDHQDALQAGTLALTTTVTADDLPDGAPQPSVPVIGPIQPPTVAETQGSRGGSVEATLPTGPAVTADLATTNGNIGSTLSGPALEASTTNGNIGVEAGLGLVDASTTNGGIDLVGTFGDVDASSTNGGIDVVAKPGRSATWQLSSSNGGIDVLVPQGPGYAVEASTTNGDARATLQGFTDTDDSETRVEGQTSNYASASVRLALDASTTNGDVDIQDQ